ncbi:Serine/threonine-protein phosphatase 6 regulatory ankyrin repeat subunit C [Penicillium subrubescens]|uniref:Serine/threonine-protein phosphatase 6 regulatory ankyrin repeat subunit C n=1 Tax=Penicillium subrubescens TaxID=1316194 RepID=A0A1Q5TUB9_9EURO|nr:Serine/threonine-protein phosphatase 6 regulatory ankyrin repeat subunit C [Penicillium subrubescens]
MKTPIFWAVLCGDREKVEALLSLGADINASDYYLETPLTVAALQGMLSMVDYLLDRGSIVSAEDIAGNTALFHVAGAGYEEVARLLLEKGANIHHKNALMETPLFWAARNGHATVTDLLLTRGTEADPRNMFLETPLLHAASEADAFNEEKYTPTVHLLVERGANVDPTYHDTDTIGVYDLLVEKMSGCAPNLKSADGETPLYRAAVLGFDDLVKLLCVHGANPNLANRFGRTPLMVAVVRGHWKCVMALLAVGTIDRDATDILGCSASSEAEGRGVPLVKGVLLGGYTNLEILEAANFQQIGFKPEQCNQERAYNPNPDDIPKISKEIWHVGDWRHVMFVAF